MIRVAINGYGRIGRVAHRVILEKFADQIELVAANGGDSTDIRGWAYLLKYDTAYGILTGHTIDGLPPMDHSDQVPKLLGHLVVDGKNIPFYSEKKDRKSVV